MIKEILFAMFNILASLAPPGVDPLGYWITVIAIFSLTYTLALMSRVFRERKGLAFILAVAISYFATASGFITIFLSKYFPNLAMVIFAILGFIFVYAFVTGKGVGQGSWFLLFFGIIGVCMALWYAIGPSVPGGASLTAEDWAIVILIVAVIVFIAVVLSAPGKKTFWDYFKEFFKPTQW